MVSVPNGTCACAFGSLQAPTAHPSAPHVGVTVVAPAATVVAPLVAVVVPLVAVVVPLAEFPVFPEPPEYDCPDEPALNTESDTPTFEPPTAISIGSAVLIPEEQLGSAVTHTPSRPRVLDRYSIRLVLMVSSTCGNGSRDVCHTSVVVSSHTERLRG
jgi:hypothetical protein